MNESGAERPASRPAEPNGAPRAEARSGHPALLPEWLSPESPPERMIPRFTIAERISHWLYAAFFLFCFVSGLLMWIPASRVWMGGARATLSTYHWIAGLLMIGLPLALLLLTQPRRLIRGVRQVDSWSRDDRRWFVTSLRRIFLPREERLPLQGRFNAGQKAGMVLVAALAVGFLVTGLLLVFRREVPFWLVERALWMHEVLAAAAIALLLIHVALAVATFRRRTYLNAMIRGSLAESTARERHYKWWASMTGTASRAGESETVASGTVRNEAADGEGGP